MWFPGSDEANATWVPGRDGVQPLETEVRVGALSLPPPPTFRGLAA